MNNNPPFARITATLMIAAGLGAGWTGYQYHQNSIADQFHISEASELRVRILQAIYMSERAATNSTLVDELSALDTGIESSFQRLISGDPSKGIPPPAQSLVSQALQLQTIWASILTNLDPIIGSKLSTEAFTRARVDTLSALEPALADTQTALARHKSVGGSDTQQKTLMSAAESLREAATIVNSETANIESLRSAEAAISSYLGSISSIARNLPKDNELLEVMGRSYRGVQNVQRQMARMIETAGSASTNVPHARAIWAERDRVNAASASMVDIAKTLPSLHVIQPLIVGILGAIALLMAVISSIVTQRSAANRAQVVESRGNTIMSSQKDRSKDLTQLLNDIHAFGNGKIEHIVVDDRESTKEIAKGLNDVFGKLRAIIEEADSTIAGLSAATEQTVLTSQNVDRNRQEQLKALEHINRMIGDLVLFIGKVQQMTSQTDSVSKDVTRIVTSGSSAVQEVHEGILQISDTNTGIQHRSKSLIESFSQLESIAAVVKQVAEKSELLSWNARLAVGAAGDTESRR
jgi:methyl-accepting chemotaxis protein